MTARNKHLSEEYVAQMIENHLGDIGGLPEDAREKISNVYQRFFSAYLEVARQKGGRNPVDWQTRSGLDPEVVAYMRHFFSDYQSLYRQFMTLNRNAKALMRIDQRADPVNFKRQWQNLETDAEDATGKAILERIISDDSSDTDRN